jgi:long-chain acyl-CoA synthetase
MTAHTIIDRLWERASFQPEVVALRFKHEGRWRDITWADYGDTTTRAAAGLRVLGFRKNDTMGLLSGNRPEWHFADIGCMSGGGVTVPIYATSSPQQVGFIAGHSECKVIAVEDGDQLDKVLEVRSQLPALQKVIVLESSDVIDDDLVMSWSQLVELGVDVPGPATGPDPEDLATLVYTSGTTGPPKGVMLKHSNLWWTCRHTEEIFAGRTVNARTISYLPLSHIAERMLSHLLQIYYGMQTWFAESLDTIVDDMKDCRPTYFFAVPRVWEKFHAGIQGKLSEADPNDRKTKLALSAIELGRRVSEAEQVAIAKGGRLQDAKVPAGVKFRHALLDRFVLRRIREALGLDHCNLPASAAAPMQDELTWFWHSIGVKIVEGYGQSEDNGPTSFNLPDSPRIGTVGRPLQGVEVKIAEDGEILVKGGNVTPGYFKDEPATRELFDPEGWMRSGDIGVMDDLGFLKITDRKKDLIITAAGKNIPPQEIEGALQISPLISQAVVVGDRRPFLTALITLDPERARAWGGEFDIGSDIAEIARHERTLKELEVAVEEVNKTRARAEGIKKFRVLDRDFLQEHNEITPTMKVKRRHIAELYGEIIEEMYRPDAPDTAAAAAPSTV